MEYDRWSKREGSNHEKYSKQVGNVLLTTVISRSDSEYGDKRKHQVLKQLDVDEATFYKVLRVGKSAQRPTQSPSPPPATGVSSWCVAHLSKYLDANEILQLTPVEAEHVVTTVIFVASRELDRGAVRSRVYEGLAEFRTP